LAHPAVPDPYSLRLAQRVVRGSWTLRLSVHPVFVHASSDRTVHPGQAGHASEVEARL